MTILMKYFRKMLTCIFRAQDNDLKIEVKNICCIEKISFLTFKIKNAQFPRLNYYI